LTIYGKDYTLDLERNKGLVTSTFKEVHFSSTGEPVVTRGLENCYYHGTIRDIESSRVVISTCDGLRGMFYHGTNPDDFYIIEPAAEQV
jgi:disintegrin/metalloproteinase domain-containing protein 19